MAAVVSLNQAALPEPINTSERQLVAYGFITLSGNYGVANGHGDALAFGGIDGIKSNQPPTDCFIYEEPTAGNAPCGFSFLFARGPDINTCKIVVLQGGAGNAPSVEVTQGAAYAAALTAATVNIKFVAEFPINI